MHLNKTAWDDPDFVKLWNETYGIDMDRSPIRQNLLFPILAACISFKGKRLIDFGCGNGNLINHFKRESFDHWLGIDSGSAVVESAKRLSTDERVEIRHQSVLSSMKASEQETFDVATCLFVIEEIGQDDLVAMFNVMSSALKKGGQVFIFTNHPANAIVDDILTSTNAALKQKFPDHKGYFDTNPTQYSLSVLNQEKGYQVYADYKHTTMAGIINAVILSGLSIGEVVEIPSGVINTDALESYQPKKGDFPRFLFMKLEK